LHAVTLLPVSSGFQIADPLSVVFFCTPQRFPHFNAFFALQVLSVAVQMMRSHQQFLLFAAVVLGCCAATAFAGEQTLHIYVLI